MRLNNAIIMIIILLGCFILLPSIIYYPIFILVPLIELEQIQLNYLPILFSGASSIGLLCMIAVLIEILQNVLKNTPVLLFEITKNMIYVRKIINVAAFVLISLCMLDVYKSEEIIHTINHNEISFLGIGAIFEEICMISMIVIISIKLYCNHTNTKLSIIIPDNLNLFLHIFLSILMFIGIFMSMVTFIVKFLMTNSSQTSAISVFVELSYQSFVIGIEFMVLTIMVNHIKKYIYKKKDSFKNISIKIYSKLIIISIILVSIIIIVFLFCKDINLKEGYLLYFQLIISLSCMLWIMLKLSQRLIKNVKQYRS